MSSEDSGETTGDSPSRLMCTDNSIDWREIERKIKCLLYADDQNLSSSDSCHMETTGKHGQVMLYMMHIEADVTSYILSRLKNISSVQTFLKAKYFPRNVVELGRCS